jgi:hypothetical protein
MENDFGRLPEGNFVQRLWQLQGAYPLDSESRSDQLCALRQRVTKYRHKYTFPWTIKPGNDLFIVWNRGWQRQILSPHESSRRQHRARQRHRCNEAPLDSPAVGLTPRHWKDREKICPRNVLIHRQRMWDSSRK